ncbi:MAG: pantetheine-phosphate adenylyltransferase [Syntrophaceticus sp.]|jgi:pantetheine-phosphate adenylyltransferase|nr:pantetheine-phosphate adenylyltransferase [Syntrophaceticus sp.]MDD3314059.1 pantetheine-phosphate adenylyltransferase [Syntrophaceticus sp.]MDD4359574.1 pantetheine-phosphate adenylyltransferase [Syntrophaceticus sp.]MDD4782990.1 pantetheine-phosphate adenylyltransferase [Syntrophaceticus sp.]HBG22391.1 pantetheine-phosphate adenylyltransferase [Peptococcaceae bacterium]
METAVYPGSFDPFTYGHLDIITRAAIIFNKVIVAVSVNSGKDPLFTIEERVEMITGECQHIKNVEVTFFYGLLVDFAKEKEAEAVIRGLRAVSDFEYEFQMAMTNRKLYPDLETICFVTQPKYSFLSSSIVKEIASLGGDVSSFVSRGVAEQLYAKYKNNKPGV